MTHFPGRSQASGLLLVAALLLLVFPALLDPFRLNLIGKYLAFGFVAIGVVLTWGYGGILSLGQGVFFGAGGYMMAMLLKLEASAPELPDFMIWSSVDSLPAWWEPFRSFPATLALILVLPAVFSYLFSYAIFKKRVGGVYFAIVTLALALTFSVLIVGQQGSTGGSNGITDFTTLLGWDIYADSNLRNFYFVEVVLLLVTMVGAVLLINSRLGRVLIAIRDREDRVRFSGYDTARIKAFVFMIAAVLSSVGGALYTVQVGLIAPSVVGVTASVEMVIYAAVGGRMSVPGAVIGALLIGFLKSWLSESFPEVWLYFLGAIFILVVAVMPNGLAGAVTRFRQPGAVHEKGAAS
ncbi:Branched-chain amino acid ABC transporter permease OS=Castellaniella sp OX=1955812 GN=EPN31_06940 PE=4 SV=1 [Castellaniella denitrificans]|uniref:urea ABC transporter permease subunit UrtC n=1 Tax=Castellaniella sp. TaxID=1955812 RepID=UPI002AFEE0F4|nr:urea ABC transporter permease subunit UrtC [Castellaniella sp.]